MKIFGLDFPERQGPTCETCGETMTLTERLPDSKRRIGYETQVFECYACRHEIQKSVAPEFKVTSWAD